MKASHLIVTSFLVSAIFGTSAHRVAESAELDPRFSELD